MPSRDVNKLSEPFRTHVKLFLIAAKKASLPILVTGTTRTLAEQKEYVRKGVSWTLNSKHLTGEAIDIAFLINSKLSYDAKLYEKLYKLSQTFPFIAWPYRDYGWNVDKPHFQYDKKRNVGYNKNMTIIEALKDQVRRLHIEVRGLTQKVLTRDAVVDDFKDKLKKEKKEHGETVERAAVNYKKWQKQIDVANTLKTNLKKCAQGENSKLQAIWQILRG